MPTPTPLEHPTTHGELLALDHYLHGPCGGVRDDTRGDDRSGGDLTTPRIERSTTRTNDWMITLSWELVLSAWAL